MDKTLRNTIIAGILLVSISVVFYFIYYLPNKERKLETARQECAERIKEQQIKSDRLYDSENCEKLLGGGLEKVGNINDDSHRTYLNSDEYKQKARCKQYKLNKAYSSQMYDDSFKLFL